MEININFVVIYLLYKAVVEVFKDKDFIGRECAEFNWIES